MADAKLEKVVLLSQKVATARILLLESLTQQLNPILAEQLAPNGNGTPFIDIEADPPQIAAIKKVINCLYHAENALSEWENMDLVSLTGVTLFAARGVGALTQIYKSLALLGEATPEIQSLIADNYQLLAPVFSGVYEIIKQKGWLSQFNAMDTTQKAHLIMNQGMDWVEPTLRLGPNNHPFLSLFEQMNQIMVLIQSAKAKTWSVDERREVLQKLHELMSALEKAPLMGQLSLQHLEENQAIQSVMGWFDSIEDDDMAFTHQSMVTYVAWVNHYFPQLIFALDQFEQQNYLKTGLLSATLSQSVNQFNEEMNASLANSPYGVDKKLVTTTDLSAERAKKIEERQIECLKRLVTYESIREDLKSFNAVLFKYSGQSIDEITEADRKKLRQIYPGLQEAIAHDDLELEHQLTKMLNSIGPTDSTRSEWAVVGFFQSTYHYVAGNLLVEDVLRKRPVVEKFIMDQIRSEHLKIQVAEHARHEIFSVNPDHVPTLLSERIEVLKKNIVPSSPRSEVHCGALFPVQESSLKNIRGNIAYIKQLRLSNHIKSFRELLFDGLSKRLSNEQLQYFKAIPPHVIDTKEPEAIQQIKLLDNALFHVGSALQHFESFDSQESLVNQSSVFLGIVSAGMELNTIVNALSPVAKSWLSPLLQQLTTLGSHLSQLNYRNDPSSVAKEMDAIVVAESTTLEVTEGEVIIEAISGFEVVLQSPVVESKQSDEAMHKEEKQSESVLIKDPQDKYSDTLKEAREKILARLISNLSAPLARRLVPQEQGIPFVGIQDDPPQVAAVKKLINCLYHAESAMRTWQKMDKKDQSTLNRIALAHQTVFVLSQIYKFIKLLNEASPELYRLYQDNYELLEPVLSQAKALIQENNWFSRFDSMELMKTAGQTIGDGLDFLKNPTSYVSGHTRTMVHFIAQLPQMIRGLSDQIANTEEPEWYHSSISSSQIDALSNTLELLIGSKAGGGNLLSLPSAYKSFLGILAEIKNESGHLNAVSVAKYNQWLKEHYPKMLLAIDEIECRNYLKPGTLSAPISQEIETLHQRLNTVLKKWPENETVPVITRPDEGASTRLLHFQKQQHRLSVALENINNRKKSATQFFAQFKQYKETDCKVISSEEKTSLTGYFIDIKQAIAENDLELANDVVDMMNTSNITPVTIEKIIQKEASILQWIDQQIKACELKSEVVVDAIQHLHTQHASAALNQTEKDELAYYVAQVNSVTPETLPNDKPLEKIAASSLSNIRGHIAYFQEMKWSSMVDSVHKQFDSVLKNNFSEALWGYLDDLELKGNDPDIVQQIKRIKQSLSHLQAAFVQFEIMSKNQSLIFQAKTLLTLAQEVNQLQHHMETLSPLLKKQYSALAGQIRILGATLSSISYPKDDAQEMVAVLKMAKEELSRSIKNNEPTQKTAGQNTPDRNEYLKRGANLGIKYLQLASLKLKALYHFLRQVGHKEGEPPLTESDDLAQSQLPDESILKAQVSRLMGMKLGVNISTSRVLKDLLIELSRVLAQANEIGSLANQMARNDLLLLKEKAYSQLILPLSQEEDRLALKPGTLIAPAIQHVNQLFTSVAFAANVSFADKIELHNDQHFMQCVITQIADELEALHPDKQDQEGALQKIIKENKLNHLQKQVKPVDKVTLTSALLDEQFKLLCLEHQLHSSFVKGELHKQYLQSMQFYYEQEKGNLLRGKTPDAALKNGLIDVAKANFSAYYLVYETSNQLQKLMDSAPNQPVNQHLLGINQWLLDSKTPIASRLEHVLSLPKNEAFVSQINTIASGPFFLVQFKQLIERVLHSAAKAILTGDNFFQVYKEFELLDTLSNMSGNDNTSRFKQLLSEAKEYPDKECFSEGVQSAPPGKNS